MKRNPQPDPVQPKHAAAVLILAIAVFLAYSNSLGAGLIFDNAVLLADPRIHALTAHNLLLILTKGYWINDPATGLYRPLTTLSFLLNSVAFGSGPASYHWINLALHEINVLLVYALGLLIFGRRGPSLALAALWGLHPLHTEAVTNVVGRADLLAAFAVLSGLLCYAKWSRAAGRARIAWLAGLAAAQTIGVFSKESAAILPAILLVYDWLTLKGAAWRSRIFPYAAVLLPLAAFLVLRSSLGIHLQPTYVDNPMVAGGFISGRMTALEVLGRLTWLFLWPARLSADYSYRAIPLLDWGRLGGLETLALLTTALLLAATWFAVSRKHAVKALYFFPLLFWIAYLPTSNLAIAIGSIMAERFMYLPSLGLAGWAVAAAMANWRFSPRAASLVVAALCIPLGARTYVRNFDWTDERTLWASAVAATPENARAHNNLGTALPLDPEHLPDIIAEFEAAVRIRPDFAEAHNNLGNALLNMPGRLPEAVVEYQDAVRLRPDYAEAHANLGNALLQSGRAQEAIGEYRIALQQRPDDAETRNSLGDALLHTPGRLAQAIEEFQAAVRLHPEDAEARYNLGIALMQAPDRLPDAIAQFEAALRIKSDFAEAHYNLGSALLRVPGRLPEAVGHYEAAVRLTPNLPEGHYNLARALLRIPGRLPDAISELETALRLKPDFAEAHYNLAMLLRQIPGRQAEAAKELAAALSLKPELGQFQAAPVK